MVGDVLLFKPIHDDIAKKIVRRLPKASKKIVAIAGESGCGKSEIAYKLRVALKNRGERVKILHLDNYYEIEPVRRNSWRRDMGSSYVGLSEINWRKLKADIRSFTQDKKATIPFIDLWTQQIDQLTTSFEGIDTLILEGLYALHAPSDLRFFVDVTYKQTLQARKKRKKEKIDAFRNEVLQAEHLAVQSTRKRAHYLIQTTGLQKAESAKITKL